MLLDINIQFKIVIFAIFTESLEVFAKIKY